MEMTNKFKEMRRRKRLHAATANHLIKTATRTLGFPDDSVVRISRHAMCNFPADHQTSDKVAPIVSPKTIRKG